jgi:hypothetical protein
MQVYNKVDCVWNVMPHALKSNFVFLRNGRVHLNRRGRQFSRLLAVEEFASAVVMLDTPCSEVVWRVLATQSISQFPLHFPSRASPRAITFQLNSTTVKFTLKHDMKAQSGVEVWIYAAHGHRIVVGGQSHALAALSLGIGSDCHCTEDWEGLRASLNKWGKEKIFCPHQD